MKQPTTYNDTEEDKQKLIKWLIDDLEDQKGVIATTRGIAKSEVKNEDLILNIGSDYQKIKINFDFNFWEIFSKLPNEDKKYTCPYKVNCTNVIFKREVNLGFFKSKESSKLDIPKNEVLGDFGNSLVEKLVNCDAQKSHPVIYLGIFIFKESVNFNNSTFEKSVNLGASTFEGVADFNYSTFKETADFSASTFEKSVNFDSSTFEGLANFKSINFIENVSFRKATFNNKVLFGLSNGEEGVVAPTTFTKEVTFERTVFEGEADFKYVVFNETANFTFTIFKGEADFKYAKVKNDIIFNNTSLYDRGAFWEIEIDNDVLEFENIKLSDKSNIYFGGVKNTETTIKIKNTVVSGRIDFNDLEIKEIDFEKSIIVGNGVVTRIRFETKCSNSQTARLLKHEAYKISNVIEGLKYKAIEKDKYEKELIDKKNKTTQEWGEILSIWLSKLSNNHGQDWIKAVVFTIASGLLFFTLSIIPITITKYLYILLSIYFTAFIFEDICRYVINIILICTILFGFIPFLYEILPYMHKIIINYSCFSITDVFNYFVPTNFSMSKLLKKATEVEKFFSYTTYFMGKIAIGYGMVEIVQAFRKLNSK